MKEKEARYLWTFFPLEWTRTLNRKLTHHESERCPTNAHPLLPLLFSSTALARAVWTDAPLLTRARIFTFWESSIKKTSSPWLQCEGIRVFAPAMSRGALVEVATKPLTLT